MTNKERYKQAFSVVHASHKISLEVEEMKKMSKQYQYKGIAASVAACLMIVGSSTAAYAMNLGGIQRTLQLWIQGDQTEVTMEFDGNGSYQMEFLDKEGNLVSQGGGGVAIGADGTERPQSEEELLEQLMAPTVEYKEDGSVWVNWLDQKIEITDQFEKDVCYVQLRKDQEILYMTVRYQDGFSTSPNKYLNP